MNLYDHSLAGRRQHPYLAVRVDVPPLGSIPPLPRAPGQPHVTLARFLDVAQFSPFSVSPDQPKRGSLFDVRLPAVSKDDDNNATNNKHPFIC